MRWLRFLLITLVAVLSASCNSYTIDIPSGVPVSGKIYLADGAPLGGGRLILMPMDEGNSFSAFADIKSDGSFKCFNQKEQETVVPGKYKVYVAPTESVVRKRVHPRYHSFEKNSSDVEVVIEGATSTLQIRLKK